MPKSLNILVPLALAVAALAGGAAAREQADRSEKPVSENEAKWAAEAKRGLDRELAGLVPGRESSCLPASIQRYASSRIYGDSVVYVASGGLKYRSVTNVPCDTQYPRVDTGILVTTTPIGRTCAGDPARVVDRFTGVLRGVCAFGPFVPYRRP